MEDMHEIGFRDGTGDGKTPVERRKRSDRTSASSPEDVPQARQIAGGFKHADNLQDRGLPAVVCADQQVYPAKIRHLEMLETSVTAN